MKKIVAIVLALVMVLACTAAFAAGESPETKDFSNITIGVSIPQLSNAAWRVWADAAEACCASLGCKCVVVDCEGDDTKQYNQIMDLCVNGVDGILILANQDATLESLIDICQDYNIPCVNGRVAGYNPSNYDGDALILSAGTDWTISGYEQAKALYEAGYHKVVASGGKEGVAVADARYNGLVLFAEDCPDFEIVAGLRTDETRTQGMANMENFISAYNGEFDCVWTTNDDTALGCLEALTAAGLNGKIGLGGIDVLDESLAAMHKGEQQFDTFMDPFSNEWGLVVAMFDYINGFAPDCESLACGLLDITPANVQDYEDAFVTGNNPPDAKLFSKVYNPDAKTQDCAAMVEVPASIKVVTELTRASY